ncbi:hypothetical protein AHMF7605_24370 [Adhaeribacter arboris]|uniref:PE-PGRS family protein n=1 Tax=Adhaeribacter arboris TaxID=2072846 RepID=A0A2T2YLP4_9BACT|nr:hypothetical protein [Adhaeribacter arboris]PSR56409.1 hypothetical protein AHMF7605_24370 [Adhaeribacter arboris]
MLLEKLFTVYVFFQTLLCGCSADRRHAGFQVKEMPFTIREIGKMNKRQVKESSGLELTPDEAAFWTHSDSGNPAQLYQVSAAGKWLKTVDIPNTTNLDWEDLTKDDKDYLYIGDFGNNLNSRKNLRIFRVKEKDVTQLDTISFTYADQKSFPPARKDWTFNCEAFFYYQDSLYLFSKNRNTRHTVKLYKIPAQPGSYVAKVVDSLVIDSRITAADISPDGQTVALLGYGNLYLFKTNKGLKFFSGEKYCRAIPQTGQAEALVFTSNNELIISNEGGKIFKVFKK